MGVRTASWKLWLKQIKMFCKEPKKLLSTCPSLQGAKQKLRVEKYIILAKWSDWPSPGTRYINVLNHKGILSVLATFLTDATQYQRSNNWREQCILAPGPTVDLSITVWRVWKRRSYWWLCGGSECLLVSQGTRKQKGGCNRARLEI